MFEGAGHDGACTLIVTRLPSHHASFFFPSRHFSSCLTSASPFHNATRAGMTLGLVTMCHMLGGAASNLLGELVADERGYEAAFVFLGAVGVVPLVLFSLFFVETKPMFRESFSFDASKERQSLYSGSVMSRSSFFDATSDFGGADEEQQDSARGQVSSLHAREAQGDVRI